MSDDIGLLYYTMQRGILVVLYSCAPKGFVGQISAEEIELLESCYAPGSVASVEWLFRRSRHKGQTVRLRAERALAKTMSVYRVSEAEFVRVFPSGGSGSDSYAK
jgi:hypothetical protein